MVGALIRTFKHSWRIPRVQAEDHLNLENSQNPDHDLGSILFCREDTTQKFAVFHPIVR